mgnify:CR=1 FL=1
MTLVKLGALTDWIPKALDQFSQTELDPEMNSYKVYHTYMKYCYMIGDYQKCTEKGGLTEKKREREKRKSGKREKRRKREKEKKGRGEEAQMRRREQREEEQRKAKRQKRGRELEKARRREE